MTTITLNSDNKISLPKYIRQKLNIRKGQKFLLIPYDGRLELIMEKDIKQFRGFLSGIDTSVNRENDRL